MHSEILLDKYMAATIKCVTAHIIFQVIKVLYNDYNYYKLIINYITKLFMKRTRYLFGMSKQISKSQKYEYVYTKELILREKL